MKIVSFEASNEAFQPVKTFEIWPMPSIIYIYKETNVSWENWLFFIWNRVSFMTYCYFLFKDIAIMIIETIRAKSVVTENQNFDFISLIFYYTKC